MMPLAIEVLALKLLISFLGLPISYLYYIVGEKQFTTIKFKNCEGAWHQVTNPGALREIKMLSLIHISEPTRQEAIAYAVFCL